MTTTASPPVVFTLIRRTASWLRWRCHVAAVNRRRRSWDLSSYGGAR